MVDAERRITKAERALMERIGRALIGGLAPDARPKVSVAEALDGDGRVTWTVTARLDGLLPGA